MLIAQQALGWRGRRNRRVHVGLELGRAQGAVVDTDLIDTALEELAPHAVAADAQRPTGNRHVAGLRLARDLVAVDIEPLGGAIVGGGQMRPGVRRQRRPTRQVLVTADVEARDGLVGVGVGIQRIRQAAGLLLEQHVAPATHGGRRIHPCRQRHAIGQIQGIGIVDRHPVVDTIEGQGTAELARGAPRGFLDGAMIALAGGVDHGRATGFLEIVGGDQPAGARARRGHGDIARLRLGVGAGRTLGGQADGVVAGAGIGVGRMGLGLGGEGAAIAEAPGIVRNRAGRGIGERHRQGSRAGGGTRAEIGCRRRGGRRNDPARRGAAHGVADGQFGGIGTRRVVSDRGVLSGAGLTVAEIPGPTRNRAARGVGKGHQQRCGPGGRRRAETGHRRRRRGCAHRDVVGLGRGVAAARPSGRELDRIGARARIGLGGMLGDAGSVVAEVPGPGRGVGRAVGELDRERRGTRGLVCAETGAGRQRGQGLADLVGKGADAGAVVSLEGKVIRLPVHQVDGSGGRGDIRHDRRRVGHMADIRIDRRFIGLGLVDAVTARPGNRIPAQDGLCGEHVRRRKEHQEYAQPAQQPPDRVERR